MNIDSSAIPFITLLAGWMLSELSHNFRSRRQHRGALGKAIADLLEIRHQIMAITKSINEIKKIIPNPEVNLPIVMTEIVKFIPDIGSIKIRYNAAVDVIAESDPILAYRLRSKEIVLNLIIILSGTGAGDPNLYKFVNKVSDVFSSGALEELDASIKSVALSYGIVIWIKTYFTLKVNIANPKEANDIIEILKEEIKKGHLTTG